MRISVKTLEKLKACQSQIDRFQEFLGGRSYVLLTERNIILASQFGLDVRWFFKWSRYTGKVTLADGTQYWYLNGMYHREDGPAIIRADGTQFWYLNGQIHREGGPAIIMTGGTQFWYLKGKFHRDDGPAIIREDGTKVWYLHGKLQRVGGLVTSPVG